LLRIVKSKYSKGYLFQTVPFSVQNRIKFSYNRNWSMFICWNKKVVSFNFLLPFTFAEKKNLGQKAKEEEKFCFVSLTYSSDLTFVRSNFHLLFHPPILFLFYLVGEKHSHKRDTTIYFSPQYPCMHSLHRWIMNEWSFVGQSSTNKNKVWEICRWKHVISFSQSKFYTFTYLVWRFSR